MTSDPAVTTRSTRRPSVRHSIPHSGPAAWRSSAAEAHAIAQADLAYLRALESAAREAAADGLSPGYALLHIFAVEPPRANTDDFEIYAIRAGNARQALAAAGADG